MASVRRVVALALAIAPALLGAASGCGLVSEETDCNSACNALNTCGLLSGGACGAYCTGTIVAVQQAGCNDAFEAQNTCVDANAGDGSCGQLSACTQKIEAFTMCLATYCKKNPGAQGCPG